MGEKGAREGADAGNVAAGLVDDLQPLGAMTSKKMFGGYGLFCEDVMFAMVDPAGEVYLRADDASKGPFESAGSAKHGRMPYWSVPSNVLSAPAEMEEWCGRALAVARAAKS